MPGLVALNIEAFKQVVSRRVNAKLKATGDAVAAEAYRLCPIDTGQLRASICSILIQETNTVQVYADAPYAAFVEFGTSRNRAHPFLRPALRAAPRFWTRAPSIDIATPNTPAKYASGMQQRAGTRTRRGTITVGR